MATEAIAYKTHDLSDWAAYIEVFDGTARFLHAPKGQLGRAHPDSVIHYWSLDSRRWIAKINREGTQFTHWPAEHQDRAHPDNHIIYLDWRGDFQKATLLPERDPAIRFGGGLIIRIARGLLRATPAGEGSDKPPREPREKRWGEGKPIIGPDGRLDLPGHDPKRPYA